MASDLISKYFTSLVDTTANYAETTYSEDTTEANVMTTTSPGPKLITPWLNTTEDLVIYASVIIGILGFVLLLAVLGWILDQREEFGDPFSFKIREMYRGRSSENLANPFGTFPHAQLASDDPDLPRWMVRARSESSPGKDNLGYEPVDQSIQAQHVAAEELEQIRSHIPDEFEEATYDAIVGGQSSPRPVRPSAIAAFERKSKRKGTQQAYDQNGIAKSAGSPNSAVPRSPDIIRYRDQDSNMYQTIPLERRE